MPLSLQLSGCCGLLPFVLPVLCLYPLSCSGSCGLLSLVASCAVCLFAHIFFCCTCCRCRSLFLVSIPSAVRDPVACFRCLFLFCVSILSGVRLLACCRLSLPVLCAYSLICSFAVPAAVAFPVLCWFPFQLSGSLPAVFVVSCASIFSGVRLLICCPCLFLCCVVILSGVRDPFPCCLCASCPVLLSLQAFGILRPAASGSAPILPGDPLPCVVFLFLQLFRCWCRSLSCPGCSFFISSGASIRGLVPI